MNAIVPIQAATLGLVPTSMQEAIKLAEMMAGAKLVPKDLQKSPADCLMVIQQAVRWQMDPFAVAQECSVIQGKLMHSGKLVAAVVNSRGNLSERLSYSYEGQGETRSITVRGRLAGENQSRTVTVRLKDAKTSARVWQTQPDQQLMYHGARVWARRHAPELMLGVWSPEEFDEQPAATPPAGARDDGPPTPDDAPHDPETGEVHDNVPQAPDDGLDIPAALDRRPKATVTTTSLQAKLKWIDEKLATFTDMEQMQSFWNDMIAPRIDGDFPPDREEALGLYRKHEQRLESV